ncbi:inositol polyphosphate 5-phosphatase [Gonapodya sp. JEL0774]|nr:inositol polyphosphate 5-phosphatase [Gonapodya sp. JEL0774]
MSSRPKDGAGSNMQGNTLEQGFNSRPPTPAQSVPTGFPTVSSLTAAFVQKSTLALESTHKTLMDVSYGCLGLVSVGSDVFLGLISEADLVGDVFEKPVFKVTAVSFFSLTTKKYDLHHVKQASSSLRADEENPNAQPVQHPCQDLIKYLSSGAFFFSPALDLTRSTQRRLADLSADIPQPTAARPFPSNSSGGPIVSANSPLTSIYSMERVDEYFFWNSYLMRELLNFRSNLFEEERSTLDREGILVALIQGFVGVSTTYIPEIAKHYKVALISRLSAKRAGTRFSTRGLDDDGYAANFVETVFWEQPGFQALVPRIEIAREFEATQPAFRSHFEALVSRYDALYIVNLLSQKDKDQGAQGGSEGQLAYWYRTHVEKSLGSNIREHVQMIDFDFHSKVKVAGLSAINQFADELVDRTIKGFGYLEVEDPRNIKLQQTGVFRVNCLDCLDRTSVTQEKIARYVLEHFVTSTGVRFMDKPSLKYSPDEPYQTPGIFSDDQFAQDWNNLWADNADYLSRIYAGTGALKSSATRHGKQTWAGLLDDAIKSGTRLVVNNVFDKSRQETINLLLGRSEQSTTLLLHDPVHESVKAEIQSRLSEYSVEGTALIQVGTWNLNGIEPSEIEHPPGLSPWIDTSSVTSEPPDIIAIAFQEIVELTAQTIVSTDPAQRAAWEEKLKIGIIETKKVDYVLLRSVQLVGASLSLFVRSNIVDRIRKVETGIMKTGLWGSTGNKGGVAIRLDYYDTSICIVTAHLAAGHSNVEDRHSDYHTIQEGLRFRNGRRIDDHQLVIWAGDFNYRIDMENDIVRDLVRVGDLAPLRVNDQLLNAMYQKRVFRGYTEGDITFKPTYKYNNGTDTYDTSEKNRIPAWCDRILYRPKERLQLYEYTTADIFTSDHRPVKALFRAKVTIVDRKKLKAIEAEARSQTRGVVKSTPIGDAFTGQLIELDQPTPNPSPAPVSTRSLPPPSSDAYKWWETPVGTQQRASEAQSFESARSYNSVPRPAALSAVATLTPSIVQPSSAITSLDKVVPAPPLSRALPPQWATFEDSSSSASSVSASLPASSFPSVPPLATQSPSNLAFPLTQPSTSQFANPSFGQSPVSLGIAPLTQNFTTVFPQTSPSSVSSFGANPAAFSLSTQPSISPTQFAPMPPGISPVSSQFRPVLVQSSGMSETLTDVDKEPDNNAAPTPDYDPIPLWEKLKNQKDEKLRQEEDDRKFSKLIKTIDEDEFEFLQQQDKEQQEKKKLTEQETQAALEVFRQESVSARNAGLSTTLVPPKKGTTALRDTQREILGGVVTKKRKEAPGSEKKDIVVREGGEPFEKSQQSGKDIMTRKTESPAAKRHKGTTESSPGARSPPKDMQTLSVKCAREANSLSLLASYSDSEEET